MSIWKQLYAAVWIAFLQIVLLAVPHYTTYLVEGHTFLGLVMLALAHYNNVQIKKTEVPKRLKRIVKATAVLATIQPILGVILFLNIRFQVGVPLIEVVSFLHLIIALAIITQASSVATAYDMWEEHEYAPSPKPNTTT